MDQNAVVRSLLRWQKALFWLVLIGMAVYAGAAIYNQNRTTDMEQRVEELERKAREQGKLNEQMLNLVKP